MRLLFFDECTERMSENFNCFAGKPDIVFMAASDKEALKSVCYTADAFIVYNSDTLDVSGLPYMKTKVFFIYDKPGIEVHLKSYCLGAESVGGNIKCEELYKYVIKHMPKTKTADNYSNDKIKGTMKLCGLSKHLKGYEYLKTALEMCLSDRENINRVTKVLYPALSKMFNTSPECIERGIRNAVELSWDSCNEFYAKLFVPMPSKRPTNSRFIRRLTEYITNEE